MSTTKRSDNPLLTEAAERYRAQLAEANENLGIAIENAKAAANDMHALRTQLAEAVAHLHKVIVFAEYSKCETTLDAAFAFLARIAGGAK